MLTIDGDKNMFFVDCDGFCIVIKFNCIVLVDRKSGPNLVTTYN